jgi:hypothetical protein
MDDNTNSINMAKPLAVVKPIILVKSDSTTSSTVDETYDTLSNPVIQTVETAVTQIRPSSTSVQQTILEKIPSHEEKNPTSREINDEGMKKTRQSRSREYDRRSSHHRSEVLSRPYPKSLLMNLSNSFQSNGKDNRKRNSESTRDRDRSYKIPTSSHDRETLRRSDNHHHHHHHEHHRNKVIESSYVGIKHEQMFYHLFRMKNIPFRLQVNSHVVARNLVSIPRPIGVPIQTSTRVKAIVLCNDRFETT